MHDQSGREKAKTKEAGDGHERFKSVCQSERREATLFDQPIHPKWAINSLVGIRCKNHQSETAHRDSQSEQS